MAVQALVKRLLLDVLKPLLPNSLEFARQLVLEVPSCRFKICVVEVDSQTETLEVEVIGNSILVDDVLKAITNMSATVHSIDEVEVEAAEALS